jgi:hypothetical protein
VEGLAVNQVLNWREYVGETAGTGSITVIRTVPGADATAVLLSPSCPTRTVPKTVPEVLADAGVLTT